MTDIDFFNDTTEEPEKGRGGVPRDGRGRALLVPRSVSKTSGVRAPYSSASGLADAISDDSFLTTWKMRYLAIAMGRNPDLAALAAGEVYNTGLYPPERRDKTQSGYRVDGIVERALDRQGISEKADYGTAIHAFTEPGNPGVVPEHMRADVESYWLKLQRECVTIVDTERFTANDKIMTAGTFDHGVRVLGHDQLTGYVIADKKTGRVDPFHWEIQLATYARGEFYDTETDERSELPADINLEFGLVIHIPALGGETTFHIVDLERGWRNAVLAAQARDAQDETVKVGPYKPVSFEERLKAANTPEELRTLWYSTTDEAELAAVTTKASTL